MKRASTSILALGLAITAAGCVTELPPAYPATYPVSGPSTVPVIEAQPVGYKPKPVDQTPVYNTDGYSGQYDGPSQYGGPAPDLVLFDGERYYGLARVISGPTDRMDYIDFNDRAASLDIRGGGYGWLVCQDANFEGPCLVARESISDLDDFGMGDKISSVRPLDPRNPYPHGTIFGENFWGDLVFYEADIFGNLDEMDPYDTWGYYAYEYGYGDRPYTGQYGDYGRYGRYNPYNPHSDYDRNDWSGYRGPRNADIVLYRDAYFRGSAYGLNRSAWSLGQLFFNDEVSSFEIRSGRWEICTDANFGGRCEIFDASQGSLGSLFFNDNISSVRRVGRYDNDRGGHHNGGQGGDRDHHNGGYGGRPGGPDRGGSRSADVVLFEHGSYNGRSYGIDSDIYNLNTIGFNDKISSIEIRSGTWEVCEHVNFGGRCQIINASNAGLGGLRLNDNISSIRRVSGGDNRPGDDGGRPGNGGDHNGRPGNGNDDRGGPGTGQPNRPGDDRGNTSRPPVSPPPPPPPPVANTPPPAVQQAPARPQTRPTPDRSNLPPGIRRQQSENR